MGVSERLEASLGEYFQDGQVPWVDDLFPPYIDQKPASRGTYHGQNGNILKVVHPGHTDLVWSTNFNDEWAGEMVCDRKDALQSLLAGRQGTRTRFEKTAGVHPEFIFSKPIRSVMVTITKAMQSGHYADPEVAKHGHDLLWKASFNLHGGNHILPNARAPMMHKFCDVGIHHHLLRGNNPGMSYTHFLSGSEKNEMAPKPHLLPALLTYFNVHLDGMTDDSQEFHDSMVVALDRRTNYQEVLEFPAFASLDERMQNLYNKKGPALAWARIKNMGKYLGDSLDEFRNYPHLTKTGINL